MQKGPAYINAVLSNEATVSWAGNVGSFLSGVENEIFLTRGKNPYFVGTTKVWRNGRYAAFSQAQRRLMKTDLKGSQTESYSIPFLFTQMLSTFSNVFKHPLSHVWKKCGSVHHGLLDVSGTAAWNESLIVFQLSSFFFPLFEY